MRYISENLMKDETIISVFRPHWIIFFRTGFLLIITTLCLQLGPHYQVTAFRLLPNVPPLYEIISAVLLIAAIIASISAFITFLMTEITVTNKRLMLRRGLIHKTTLEILLTRIESITIDQSLLARMLNYGTLLISGTGGSKDLFVDFPDPVYLRNSVQEQIEVILNKYSEDKYADK